MIRDLQSQIEELKRKLQSNEGGAFSVVKYFACPCGRGAYGTDHTPARSILAMRGAAVV
jgi:hypothetical protein